MIDLEHIHAVKAGEQPFITFIVGRRMQHLVVDHLVIIPVQHLAQQIELRFQPFRKCPQPPYKIMIQTISHIQTQAVDIELLYPAFYTVQNMINHIFMAQVDLHQIVISFPALIPEAVVVVGIAAQIDIKPAQVRRILPVLQHILKCPESPADMIEHTVQHHLDAVLVQVVTYFPEILIGTQPAVDGVIIPRIIPVGIRLEHR